MNQVDSSAMPAVRRSAIHEFRFRAAILATLTLIATLLCLVSVSSGGAEHSMADTGANSMAAHPTVTANQVPTANPVTHALPVTSARPTTHSTRTGPTMTLAAPATQPALCSEHNSLGGDTASKSCSDVLVVGSNAVFARMPSDSGLVLASGGFVNDTFRAIPLHLHRPSLTLLSISRV